MKLGPGFLSLSKDAIVFLTLISQEKTQHNLTTSKKDLPNTKTAPLLYNSHPWHENGYFWNVTAIQIMYLVKVYFWDVNRCSQSWQLQEPEGPLVQERIHYLNLGNKVVIYWENCQFQGLTLSWLFWSLSCHMNRSQFKTTKRTIYHTKWLLPKQ